VYILIDILVECEYLIVGVFYSFGQEANLVSEFLHLGDLAGADASPLLIEDVLQLDGEDLAVLVKHLVGNVGERVGSL